MEIFSLPEMDIQSTQILDSFSQTLQEKEFNQRLQFLSNLYLTKKFISVLRNLTSFRRPKWLKASHFNIMNDLSFDFDSFQGQVKEAKQKSSDPKPKANKNKRLKAYYKKSLRFMNKIINFFPIFDQTKQFSILWDTLNIIAMCFYFVLIPLDITFGILNTFFFLNMIKTFFLYIIIIFLIFRNKRL